MFAAGSEQSLLQPQRWWRALPPGSVTGGAWGAAWAWPAEAGSLLRVWCSHSACLH